MDELELFCCQNLNCSDHGKRGHGNLTVTSRYGPGKTRRMLRCGTCKVRFSERKGTPLFQARLPDDKALDVLAHLADGCGVRQTGRLAGVDKDTAARYAARAGGHARQLHDELVGLSPPHDPGPGRWQCIRSPVTPVHGRRSDRPVRSRTTPRARAGQSGWSPVPRVQWRCGVAHSRAGGSGRCSCCCSV